MGAKIIPPPADKFIDRGDPANDDFGIADFPVTGSWADLDLSAIIPAGTTAVIIKMCIKDTATDNIGFSLRKKGNIEINNISQAHTIIDKWISNDMLVPTGGLQTIQYYRDVSATFSIKGAIKGWLK